MLKDRIIEKVLNDVFVDPRISDGIFDIKNNEHVGYLCEYLINKDIEPEIVYEFCDLLLEKGKYPRRQAYNANGILVTFPTPEYKTRAIRAGTHFENDPTRGHPNVFNNETPPATEPSSAAHIAQASPTKTNLPVSTSTASPPSSEKSGEDTSSEPAQQMPNAFTTAAPQQSPQEEPSEPTKLPLPAPTPPEEKDANKNVIKKMLKGDDYMLETNEISKTLTLQQQRDLASYVKIIRGKLRQNPDAPLSSASYEIELMYGIMDNLT